MLRHASSSKYTPEYDFNMHERDIYTQSVIFTPTKVIFECYFYTQIVISTRMIVILTRTSVITTITSIIFICTSVT
jgi:hypothetical protein